jgi:hypothetical protein
LAPAQSWTDPFWLTYAEDALVFIGGAPSRANRDEAIAAALKDAARKAAFYETVSGAIHNVEKTGAGAFDFSSRTKTDLPEPETPDEMIDALEYDEDAGVRITGNSVFVRARYAHPVLPAVVYAAAAAEKPAWTTAEPVIPGYYCGVGYAGSHSRLSDTVKASYENALFSIIRQISTDVAVSEKGNGALSRTVREYTAEGTLKGFYALEVWIEPETRIVWTLAIARRE